MEEFKVGDKVYCPKLGGGIYELLKNQNLLYPLGVEYHNACDCRGNINPNSKVPDVFHATLDNKAKLESLYGIEFEEPKLTGSELTKKLLKDGHRVLCFVSDRDDCDAVKGGIIRMINEFNYGRFFLNGTVFCKRYAVPVGEDFKFAVGEVNSNV